jgi:putative hemolysin
MIAVTVLVWFFVTILMMAFFSGIEMAFYSVNRFGVELKKKQGRPGAQMLSRLIQTPELFISTTVIGFSISLVCFVLLFGTITEPMWHFVGLRSDTARLFLDIVLATFVILIFAEFIPRAIFRAHSNIILSRLVWVVNIFYQLLQPLASGLISLSNWALKYIFNVRLHENRETFVRSDLETLFQKSDDEDYEPRELSTNLFENALELPRIKIRQCLVPRKEIIAVNINCTVEEARQKFIETKLSKLIVYEGNIDHIIGYIHQLDLFKDPESLQAILHPIPAVPETMSATDLINKFTRERKSIAWVVDEFGGTAGIVTMEDVLEEIFGIRPGRVRGEAHLRERIHLLRPPGTGLPEGKIRAGVPR